MNRQTLRKYLIGDLTLRRLVRSIIFIYLCLALFAFFWSDRMIFQPQEPTYQDSEDIIKLALGDGQTISAIHLENSEARFTVLYNHANAVDLGDIRPFLENYRDLGISVFSYDYPGYGTSPGRPTTANAYASADAAMDYLLNEAGLAPTNIIIHGRSVGGGPALYLAQTREVAGVIIESSFVTAFRTATRIPLLPFDKFRNIRRIANVNCPVLIIHGLEDRTIQPWHGEKLFEKALEPKTSCWLEGTSHNTMPPEDADKYWEALVGFREMVGASRGPTDKSGGTEQVVQVVGEAKTPGQFVLTPGMTVADAIQAAGGLAISQPPRYHVIRNRDRIRMDTVEANTFVLEAGDVVVIPYH